MSRVNFLPSAVAIVFVDSRSSQCKTRHRVTTGVRKRNASTECHSWRVSEAFTRWSNSLGLFSDAEVGKVGGMSGIFPSCSEEDKWIRSEKPVIKDGIFPSPSR